MASSEELIVGKPAGPFKCALGKDFWFLLHNPEQSKTLDRL